MNQLITTIRNDQVNVPLVRVPEADLEVAAVALPGRIKVTVLNSSETLLYILFILSESSNTTFP
ncbi:MAG TPA: hypothetical protein VHH88_03940 [Verrucomicrobiae bacterium]|nr:hypothetical protein [Verrucomicrobiae bacterium]